MMNLLLSILSLVLLVSCQTTKDKEEKVVPAQESYEEGVKLFNEGSFKKAADNFGKVYFQHPGNRITPYAELMEAYSLYKSKNYSDVVDVLDNFISIHPNNENIAYAYYLKAMSYFNQISDIYHDQSMTRMSLEALESLIFLFPDTDYASDAKLKLILLKDHLAGNEMEIGRYYQNRLNPVGAINRFQTVVSNYQTTVYYPEALYRLIESFMLLGLKDEARKYEKLLETMHPESNWSIHARKLFVENRG